MTRERIADFSEFQLYISNYDLKESLTNPKHIEALKQMHKIYFSIVAWNAEMSARKAEFSYEGKPVLEAIHIRLQEVFSDLGSAIFAYTHGAYKNSRIMIRAGIENFVRSISALEEPKQLQEKNVYTLFDNATPLIIFNSSSLVTQCYKQLHSDYKLLCSDTHTSTNANMEHISSLADFPKYDQKKLRTAPTYL